MVVATAVAHRLVDNVGRVLEGKREVVELAVAAVLGRGHLLVEDVPGVGKTTLARALARSVGVSFRRIQFTSDLMPADVLGGSIFDQATGRFAFRPGPIFAHVVLADEINRTTPKTQSALLEAMDERRISIDGTTHVLDDPFFVVATQNPEEFYGTYPLPESQLDRFLLRLRIGYPPPDIERHVIQRRRGEDPTDRLEPVASRQDLLAAQEAVDSVRVDEALIDYLHAVVLATRGTPMLDLGASTRAALALERSVRAYALVRGRTYATPDDVKALAVASLAHRVRVAGAHDPMRSRVDAERVVRDLVTSITVPV
jgi:MoxR-like ATPase